MRFWAPFPVHLVVRAAEPVRILAYGNSLTAGYGLAEQDTLPTRLAEALNKMGRPVTMINGGVSGDTTADGVSRLDWALADKPQIMILALGANDMLRGLDPKATRANLEAIIQKAKAAGVEIVLAGMLSPPNLGPSTRPRSMPSIQSWRRRIIFCSCRFCYRMWCRIQN